MIAVCLYGQPRNWELTQQWIRSQYGQADYFCSIKPSLPVEQLEQIVQVYQSKSHRVEDPTFDGLGPSHYLFLGMASAIQLMQAHAWAHSIKYTHVLLQRYDLLVGPKIGQMNEFLNNPLQQDTLYFPTAAQSVRFFPHEGNRIGLPDWIIAGDPMVMGIFAAASTAYFNPGGYNEKVTDNLLYTSHSMIQKLCDSNNIKVQLDESLNGILLRDSSKHLAQSIQLNWETIAANSAK